MAKIIKLYKKNEVNFKIFKNFKISSVIELKDGVVE